MTTAAQEAMASLVNAVSTPLERNDLGRLACMHSWAQSLAAAGPSGDAGGKIGTTSTLAKSLMLLLERLILDETANSEQALALVPDLVRQMECVDRGEAVDAGPIAARVEAAIQGVLGATTPAQPGTVNVAPSAGCPTTQDGPAAAPAEAAYVSEPLLLELSEREHLDGFIEEASEHMDAIEAGLLEVETDPTDTAKVNELFRPFHTIKGIAGFLNLRDINRLTHEIETILDLGRKNELSITATTIDLIFAGVDVLKSQINAIRQFLAQPTDGPCPQPEISAMIQQLRDAAKPGAAGGPAVVDRSKLGEILVTKGVATPAQVERALEVQADEPPPARKLGEILVSQPAATPGEVEKALAQQASGQPVMDQSIRVDTRKLDILVDAVGELVIAQSMVSLAEGAASDDKLHRNVSQVTKIVRDVQETAMAMRMVPIGHTFQKMRRLVRDVARKANKQVELTINGEETELDKNVIQQISDPLVHMVRNAVDHGIEPTAARLAAGKPATGQVWLNAFHQGDSIVIEIRDDGRGLDPEKLIAKGIERGLITPEDQLSDQQAFALIMQAGFSTAEVVTDISGRGVGMDVVRRNVEQLRGKIDISSKKGHGSVFQVRLPLTLAIIDGMLVRVVAERMIIPTIMIEQSLRPDPKQITTVQQRGALLQVRGELCPLIQLRALFGLGPPIDPCENLAVIVQCGTQKIALVVDELIGQQQVVIKTLGQRFKQVRGVSGAAILGDGRVGLILEPSGLLELHNQGRGASYQKPAAERENHLLTRPEEEEERIEEATGDALTAYNAPSAKEPVSVTI